MRRNDGEARCNCTSSRRSRTGQRSGRRGDASQGRGPSRAEAGCRGFHVFRASRHGARFVIHSIWADEKAFDLHATPPHTVVFLATMKVLVDRPPDLCRTEMIL
jgi:quinol monooxygenase YgiN